MIDVNFCRFKLVELCRRLSVRRLELVGSAARDDFNPGSSDVDMLFGFEGKQVLFDWYFELKSGLEDIFGRKVDLIQNGAVQNPYIRESIEQDRISIYEEQNKLHR